MKINLSTSNASIAGEFTLMLFNVRTVAHILHLNTRSYAAHTALDGFYSGIVDLADRFAEASIGHFKTITWPESMTEGLMLAADPVQYLTRVKEAVEKANSLVQEEDLRNILAEILELTSSTLYKLENLS
jgi:hypothetical protein